MNIVPSNFLAPFLESDTLQIIFLAVIVGIAIGKIGDHAQILQDLFASLNSLFLAITSMISKVIPVAVFCSMAIMIYELGSSSFLSVLSLAGTEIVSIFCMICIYGLLILIIGRLNPLAFYRKDWEGMLTSFTLSSSNAAMPTNMRICSEKLGISNKICSFSIPLGATVNMDGASIFLVTMGLGLARAYGITVPTSTIFSFLLTVILLSLGAPGVPGATVVCLGVILNSLGVPVEGLGLVIAVYPFLDMFNTMNNTTGDVASSLIVAKSERLVDLNKYRSK